MKVIVLILALLLPAYALGGDVHDKMRDVSVTVFAKGGNGSGVVRQYKDETFVVTCSHVIAGSQKQTYVIENGFYKLVPSKEFEEIQVAQYNHLNGLKLNYVKVPAEVVFYTPYEQGDVAVLKVKRGRLLGSVRWAKSRSVGQDVYHCGSPHGWANAQTITFGAILKTADDFDIVSALFFEGSSGGCLFNDNAEYLGMTARRPLDSVTNGLVIPIHTIKKILVKNKFGFLFEDN